ncbi:hypothetical protein NLM59_06845 [Weeksellaceae bacterium KMM 9724]|uniref:hypothetical protein n=1 Tax=Profundicola chukchiensis TaxID=2961959 RepID=UPI00243EEFFD|nr:hypothetical protein [Profundicola chukchiensis]MDG4950636.1 hypothetical protein [Profundicola chukchiensis]
MRKLLPNIYHAIISSQAWVAFCFALLCKYIQLINAWDCDVLIFLAFFATLFAYNLSHWVTDKENWRMLIMVFSGLFSLVLGLIYLKIQIVLILSVLAFISIYYSYAFNKKRLRNLPNIKMISIALVWSITAILPAFNDLGIVGFNLLNLVLSLFFFVVAITIPFDIRDLEEDDESIKTLPQQFGVSGSIKIGVMCIGLSFILFLNYFSFKINQFHIPFLVTLFIALIFLLNSSKTKNKWFTTFWIEGLSALSFILFWIFN